MGLRELLLQKLLGTAEIVREAFRHALQGGLRTAFFHLDREDGLVQLRVARVIEGIFHLRVLEQGRDQRVDHRIVRIQDLDADGILLFLEDSELHGGVRRGSADLRLCGFLRERERAVRDLALPTRVPAVVRRKLNNREVMRLPPWPPPMRPPQPRSSRRRKACSMRSRGHGNGSTRWRGSWTGPSTGFGSGSTAGFGRARSTTRAR